MMRKQLLVALGIAAAIVICLIVFTSLHLGGAPDPSAPQSQGDRLAYAAHWLLAPALCLLAGVGMTGNRRFLSKDAIDGAREGLGWAMEVNLRYNQNTLEQTVLAAVAWSGLALTLAPQDLRVIPALAALFVVGRLAFWIGYLLAPWARAFGMGLTFYPTVASLIWLVARAARAAL